MSKALLDVETLRLTRRTRSLRVIKEAISISVQNSELCKHLSYQLSAVGFPQIEVA